MEGVLACLSCHRPQLDNLPSFSNTLNQPNSSIVSFVFKEFDLSDIGGLLP